MTVKSENLMAVPDLELRRRMEDRAKGAAAGAKISRELHMTMGTKDRLLSLAAQFPVGSPVGPSGIAVHEISNLQHCQPVGEVPNDSRFLLRRVSGCRQLCRWHLSIGNAPRRPTVPPAAKGRVGKFFPAKDAFSAESPNPQPRSGDPMATCHQHAWICVRNCPPCHKDRHKLGRERSDMLQPKFKSKSA